jgi:hypothetical protein
LWSIATHIKCFFNVQPSPAVFYPLSRLVRYSSSISSNAIQSPFQPRLPLVRGYTAYTAIYGAIFWVKKPFFFLYNLNQQSQFTFYKLMLWLLQCLDGDSSSGESPVPQIRSIGQFLLSHLFPSLVLRSGFSWVPSLVWCLLHFWWMTSCTYGMPRSACSVALETYHGASTIILRILDWLLCIIVMLDLTWWRFHATVNNRNWQ